MLIDQPVRGKGLPYWSQLHEALAAFYWMTQGYDQVREAAMDPRIKKETEAWVREFLKSTPGQWLVEAVHGIPPPASPAVEGGGANG